MNLMEIVGPLTGFNFKVYSHFHNQLTPYRHTKTDIVDTGCVLTDNLLCLTSILFNFCKHELALKLFLRAELSQISRCPEYSVETYTNRSKKSVFCWKIFTNSNT